MHPAKAVAEFVARVRKESPDTAILIDEAYHDYVTDPAYATAVPLALEHPNVFVTRTLSKAYGMAGMRVGYAIGQPRTIEGFNRWAITFNQNSLAVAAAVAALGDPAHIEAERARNAEARAYTDAVLHGPRLQGDGLADQLRLRRDRPLRAGRSRRPARERGIMVGREFPPLEKTHARVSIGTLDEMQRAGVVIAEVLGTDGPARPSAGRLAPAAMTRAWRKEDAMASHAPFVRQGRWGSAGPACWPLRARPGPRSLQAPGARARAPRPLLLHNNENPLGPGRLPSSTPCAPRSATGGPAGRYPFGQRPRPPRGDRREVRRQARRTS